MEILCFLDTTRVVIVSLILFTVVILYSTLVYNQLNISKQHLRLNRGAFFSQALADIFLVKLIYMDNVIKIIDSIILFMKSHDQFVLN